MSEIFNTECFNENSKIRIQRPGDKENYVRRKIPLQRSLSSSSTFSSSPFPQLMTPPDISTTEVRPANSSPSADPSLLLQNETVPVPLLKKKNHRSKKPANKTTSRKLSSSNVDKYMTSMSKIGEEIVAAGKKIATALGRSIPSNNLIFEGIAETLTRIASSTESLASSAKRIVCSLETITSAESKTQ
ncbi:uncharacterized protein LOC124815347 [Hydra vulgaris]|uniref:uncharacterized protein LOC124815347 n=1 Tax=Hydra vulgaris TaxID=6087 RepID=UPI001F5EC39C|nr:uncharacterized protein LOC124815347 [Hydra vulgaris]